MSTVQEKRTQMIGSHFTPSEKDFIRLCSAKTRKTISNFIRDAIANECAKIEDPENPFCRAENNS